MTDIILFRPKYTKDKNYIAEIPLNLLYVSSFLEKKYSIKIIDELITPDWKGIVKKEISDKPLLAGVTSMTGHQIGHALEFSKFIKEHSNVPVIWGGVHASLLPEQTLEKIL